MKGTLSDIFDKPKQIVSYVTHKCTRVWNTCIVFRFHFQCLFLSESDPTMSAKDPTKWEGWSKMSVNHVGSCSNQWRASWVRRSSDA